MLIPFSLFGLGARAVEENVYTKEAEAEKRRR